MSRLHLLVSATLILFCFALASGKGKTVYVHLLDGDDKAGDGSYASAVAALDTIASDVLPHLARD